MGSAVVRFEAALGLAGAIARRIIRIPGSTGPRGISTALFVLVLALVLERGLLG